MTARIFAIVPAMVLALSATTALAQPAARPFAQFDRASLITHDTALRPVDGAAAMVSYAAYLGEGWDASHWRDQQEQTGVPEYSTSNGAAYVTDGSDPSYLRDQQELMSGPGYSIGNGAAYVSDGSDPSYLRVQQALMNEPGYSIGTGAARISSAS
jgi:hypothetical protein